jgi:ABC-type multidrug transport system fused ATPase/permease subunit
VFALLKAFFLRAPIGLAFYALANFYNGTASGEMCLRIGVAIVVCVLLQAVFQHIENVLQTSAGFIVMAEKRMELGARLRRLPMGYFTEGNIGKISSVLTSDMGFVETNCMMVLADLMGYLFAQLIMLIFLLAFNVWLGVAAAVVILAAMPFGNWLRKDALRESHRRQEQNENLTKAALEFIEGIGIIKAYNLLGEKIEGAFRQFPGNLPRQPATGKIPHTAHDLDTIGFRPGNRRPHRPRHLPQLSRHHQCYLRGRDSALCVRRVRPAQIVLQPEPPAHGDE